MLPKDFRGYLSHLEAHGALRRVTQEVDPRHQMAAGVRRASDTDGPALLFENVKGYPGWRVAAGLFATRRLMALALETEPDERAMLARYLEFDQGRVPPCRVETGPVKEIVLTGDDVDLDALPILTYSEKDGGRFLIPAADIVRDPVSGAHARAQTERRFEHGLRVRHARIRHGRAGPHRQAWLDRPTAVTRPSPARALR